MNRVLILSLLFISNLIAGGIAQAQTLTPEKQETKTITSTQEEESLMAEETMPITSLSNQLQPCNMFITNTIYADAFATTTGNGSKLKPYQTLAEVETRLQNDANVRLVCLEGIFSNQDLDLSGSLTDTLSIYGYNGRATIQAGSSWRTISNRSQPFKNLRVQNLNLVDYSSAALDFSNVDNLIIKDIAASSSRHPYRGFEVENNGAVTIQNASVTSHQGKAIDAMYTTSLKIKDVSVNNNFIGRTLDARMVDSIFIEGLNALHGASGISSDLLMYGNIDITMVNSNVDTDADDAVSARADNTLIFSHNRITNYKESGLSGSGLNATITHNEFYGDNAEQGIKVMYGADDVLVANNMVAFHSREAIEIVMNEGFAKIYHNTLANNDDGIYFTASSYDLDYQNIVIEVLNNIFYNEDDSAIAYSHFHNHYNVTLNHNLFYGGLVTYGVDFNAWQSTSSHDQASLEADPHFKSATDFHIESYSPAIDQGLDLTALVSNDLDLEIRDRSPDIGADEVDLNLDDDQTPGSDTGIIVLE